jgi:hypothetical protein
MPSRPVPSKNMLVGSGTALPVICPWTVVIPLFDAGGTRFNGLLVIEYVIPPIVTDDRVKLTTPLPELLALNIPEKVAEKLSLPAIGTVWVMVSVKVPEAAITPVPETKVWKLPKLEPVGVFRLVDPRPVNVIMRALPMPPRKVTELVPLPAHPAQVKTPDVENVTGSALASDVLRVSIARSNALIRVALNTPAMSAPFGTPRLRFRTLPSTRERHRMA